MLKHVFAALLFLVPPGLFAGNASVTVGAADPRIQYTGRFDHSDPKAPRFDWPDTSITVRFKGSSIGFLLEDGKNDFNLYIDDKPVKVWATETGKIEYSIGGLGEGEHTALLTKRTEGYFGVTTFKGIVLPKGGELFDPPARPSRKIEFLGASWTCGYGNEGKSIQCPDLRTLENAHLAFGPLAAKVLGAECRLTAFSGRGVVRNYGEKTPTSPEPFGVYFDRTLVNDPNLKWDFKRWVPDVVVVNLGVNDYSTQPVPDTKRFVDDYVALLKRVRAAYPDAWIVSYNATGWPNYIQHVHAAVAVFNKSDWKALSLEFAPYPASQHACDYHPNLEAHWGIADDLAKQIKGLWDAAPNKKEAAQVMQLDIPVQLRTRTKQAAFEYTFKGPLDESVWERGKYPIDDKGSDIKESEARDGAECLTLWVSKLSEKAGLRTFTGSGVMTRQFFNHGRFTVRMKSNIKPGTVSSFFLMNKWEPGRWFHKEIDIEFLGKDPNLVQFVVHRYYSDQGWDAMGKAHVHTLPFKYGDGFHDYSILWTKDKVEWAVDGEKVWETAKDLPDEPLNIFMNHWGPDPGLKWSSDWLGQMDINALPSTAEYQWVKYEPL